MIVRSRRVALPEGVRPATVVVRDGRISAVAEHDHLPAEFSGLPLFDYGELAILPGVVDSHVHVNEPGRTDWEGFETATRAAAAGGVTTLVDMPLNSVPATVDVAALKAKQCAAQGQCFVDVAFWGGVVPGNASQLAGLAAAGARGFKCFLSPSGVDEFQHVDEGDLRAAMPILAGLRLPLLVHAEWPLALQAPAGNPAAYRTWLDSRPPAAELVAIEWVMRLAEEYGTRVHIVHLATGEAVPLLRAARSRGVGMTVETCPHYLTFAAEEIEDGDTRFKCAPPIRSRDERERLWRAVLDGTIALIATDHSPAPPAMKRMDEGDFIEAWGGIASLQLGLSAVWTGANARGADLSLVAKCMSRAPARLAGLWPRKGAIAVGSDADLIVFDPDGEFTVDQSALFHRHPLTPYDGRRLRGIVQATILRGRFIFDQGTLTGPKGELL